MLNRIDQDKRFLNLVKWLSNVLARNRGLPVVVGVVFVLVSLVVQSINVYADAPLLELLGVIFLHVGILSGLIGLLLAEPLGK